MTVSRTKTQAEITAHYLRHWGPPTEIHISSQSEGSLAVLEFAPRPSETAYRYGTNGMSKHAHVIDGQPFRTELMVRSHTSRRWIIRLLEALATYPEQHGEALSESDTLPVGQPLDGVSSPFRGLLLLSADPEEETTLGAIIGIYPEPILVHRVVGLYQSELDFAVQNGSDALSERLLGLGCPLLIDIERPRAA